MEGWGGICPDILAPAPFPFTLFKKKTKRCRRSWIYYKGLDFVFLFATTYGQWSCSAVSLCQGLADDDYVLRQNQSYRLSIITTHFIFYFREICQLVLQNIFTVDRLEALRVRIWQALSFPNKLPSELSCSVGPCSPWFNKPQSIFIVSLLLSECKQLFLMPHLTSTTHIMFSSYSSVLCIMHNILYLAYEANKRAEDHWSKSGGVAGEIVTGSAKSRSSSYHWAATDKAPSLLRALAMVLLVRSVHRILLYW